MNQEDQEIYDEGFSDYCDDVPLAGNPYRDERAALWHNGWLKAQDQYMQHLHDYHGD